MSRGRLLAAALFVAVVAVISTAYSYAAPKRYDATARVVVHPIPANVTTYTGIDVLVEAPDAARVVETAAHYFDTPEVIDAVATRLGRSASSIRGALDVHPLAGSNIVLVVGKDRHADAAARIANAIVDEGIAQETARFQAQVGAVLAKLRSSPSLAAQQRINNLKSVQSRPDPTLQSLSAASAPSRASWPKPSVVIPKATLAALGLGALFLLLPPLAVAIRRSFAGPSAAQNERDRALDERDHAMDERERALNARAHDLDERVAEVTTRERATVRQAAELSERARELEAREAELAERAEEVERREQEPPPEPEPVRIEAPTPGEWRIEDLEHVVAERGDEFPDRVEEWRYYVHFLREHADADGLLPASFDYLIAETFAELL